MSFNYTRVVPEPMAFKTYGYQKISSQDMKSLIMRMQKPTHSSEIGGYFPEGYFKHPHRPTSGVCKRVTPGEEDLLYLSSNRPKRALPQKMVNRVVRRLQTPTLSRQAAQGLIIPEYELDSNQESRPRTAEEKRKFIQRITRPTTASKRKDMDTYWSETVESEYFERDYSNDHSAGKDEIEGIVERVRTATVASDRGEGSRCSKRRPSVHIDRDKLPLVSGLARSRRVDDIVERLYRPTTASASKCTTPASSEISSTASRSR